MFAWQRAEFSGVAHLELPGMQPANPWLQAFAMDQDQYAGERVFRASTHIIWRRATRTSTALGALAERSQLADAVKDNAVVTEVPELGPAWASQVAAAEGWRQFTKGRFRAAEGGFGVGLGAGGNSAAGRSGLRVAQ